MEDDLERQQDEAEALQAMYPDEFTETSSGEYQVTMPGGSGISLQFQFPVGYPSQAPPCVQLRHRTPSHHPLVTQDRLKEQAQQIWDEGGGEVMFELIGWLTEQEQDWQQDQHRVEDQDAHEVEQQQQREELLVSAECQELIMTSLHKVGYEKHGMCFIHEQEPRCEVELVQSGSDAVITVTAAGLGEEELSDFVAMELAADRPGEFGAQLLEGVQNMLHMSGMEAESHENSTAGATSDDLISRALAKLPSVELVRSHPGWTDCKLEINTERQLHIFTWGDALMKKTALKSRHSQFDVNAKSLNGRGGGADTKHNALQDQRIVLNVAGSLADARGMQLLVQTLRKIEEED